MAAEIKAVLGKRFKDSDEFVKYLEKLLIRMAYMPRSSPLYDKNFKRLTKKNTVPKERTLKNWIII